MPILNRSKTDRNIEDYRSFIFLKVQANHRLQTPSSQALYNPLCGSVKPDQISVSLNMVVSCAKYTTNKQENDKAAIKTLSYHNKKSPG
jgi:hypothetical protein